MPGISQLGLGLGNLGLGNLGLGNLGLGNLGLGNLGLGNLGLGNLGLGNLGNSGNLGLECLNSSSKEGMIHQRFIELAQHRLCKLHGAYNIHITPDRSRLNSRFKIQDSRFRPEVFT